MKDEQKATTEEAAQRNKAPYSKPELREFGSVHELTRGGSIAGQDFSPGTKS